jgi:tight adherence protein C
MSLDTPIGTVSSYLAAWAEEIGHSSVETWVLALALAAAVLSGFHLWRIAQREETKRLRLEALRGTTTDTARTVRTAHPPWYRRLGSLIAASPIIGTVEQQRLLKVLAAAGIKGHGNLASFVASKVCGAVAFAGLMWLLLEWRQWFAGATTLRLAALSAALMLGWRLPDLVLNRLAKRRRLRLEHGMPDALDLLVVCAEAGLSLNQAIEEISRQLRPSNPDVAEEFAATAAEMQVLPDLGQALDNLVQRTGLDGLRSLIATLKQSIKFGTPLAESLRMLAAEMRAMRQARYEERAARLPVLLAIPMMMFILPCLLMVVGTPVVLRAMEAFKSITIGAMGAP